MKYINTIKKINIIIVLILTLAMIIPNYSYAVGTAFSDADAFLGTRRFNI